jgi:hypothetical protein
MRSVQVSKLKGPLEIVEKDIPELDAAQVRLYRLSYTDYGKIIAFVSLV